MSRKLARVPRSTSSCSSMTHTHTEGSSVASVPVSTCQDATGVGSSCRFSSSDSMAVAGTFISDPKGLIPSGIHAECTKGTRHLQHRPLGTGPSPTSPDGLGADVGASLRHRLPGLCFRSARSQSLNQIRPKGSMKHKTAGHQGLLLRAESHPLQSGNGGVRPEFRRAAGQHGRRPGSTSRPPWRVRRRPFGRQRG